MKNLFWKTLFVASVVFSFVANSLHEKYPDEFDNILGGWLISHGKLPYIDFFTHHGPIPYFIASVITFISGQSFVRFRIIYSLLLVLIFLVGYIFLKKRLGEKIMRFYLFFIFFVGIMATYYWMQMLLADNIAAIVFLPVYALIALKWFYNKKINSIDVIAISLLSSIGFYSSLTYAYLFFIVLVATLYLYYKDNFEKKKLISKVNLYPILIFIFPHFVFLLYLLLTGSLSDYFYQNYTFNTKYYIYNYPRQEGSSFINPVRYALLIANQFFINFYTLLIGFKTFDFVYPVNMSMALANTGLILFFLFKKQYKLAMFVLFALIFTTVRSNPLNSKETDYQSGVYNIISFFNMFFVLPALYESFNDKIEPGKRVLYGLIFLIVGLYAFFSVFHLFLKFNSKILSKYMGTMPLIYDRPQIAPIINKVVSKNEYAWIGPFEFEELFYINAKNPSKYHILIAGVGRGEKTQKEMLADFERNKPIIIFFDSSFDYLGNKVESYGNFFINFLNKNYITIDNYKEGSIYYKMVLVENRNNIETKVYIRKDKAAEVIKKLIETGYLKP